MSTITQQINELTVKEMMEKWGGSLPSWEEFKLAVNGGRVKANKTIAAKAIQTQNVPKLSFFLYGVVTLWSGFLIVPGTIAAWFFMDFKWWWIIVAFLAAKFLIAVSREGHCHGMIIGATRNPDFYDVLIRNGAFCFDPPNTK